jgi:hypothetical protein
MDRGRYMDMVQNQNAVYLDNFRSQGKTSVKIVNPPGGKSNFSLGWGYDENANQPEPQKYGRKRFDQNNNNNQLNNDQYPNKASNNYYGNKHTFFGKERRNKY